MRQISPLSPLPSPSLTRLEVFVFSVGVGLNILSTWVLLLGLFGLLDRTWTVRLAGSIDAWLAAVWARHRAEENSKAGAAEAPGRAAPTPRMRSGDVRRRRPTFCFPQPGSGSGCRLYWRSCWPPCCRRWISTCANITCKPRKSSIEQGQITFLPHNVYANMAMGTEMLSLLAMSIAGDWWWGAGRQDVTAAFTPLCALALLSGRPAVLFDRRRRGRGAALPVDPLGRQHFDYPVGRQRFVIWTGRGGVGVLSVPGGVRGGAVPGGQVRQ